MTILIVDDDAMLARALERLLGGQGHRCFVAHSADAALAILAHDRPGFVLTDFDLGDLCNGADLACWARNAFRVPVALMTGHELGVVRSELRELGLADVAVLAKPLALETILAELAPHVEIGPWPSARAPRAT
jgi:DNA-binding response OmpR family regulator